MLCVQGWNKKKRRKQHNLESKIFAFNLIQNQLFLLFVKKHAKLIKVFNDYSAMLTPVREFLTVKKWTAISLNYLKMQLQLILQERWGHLLSS